MVPYSIIEIEHQFGLTAGKLFLEEGLKRKLVGFEVLDRGIARHGYTLHDESGSEIGVVTSGTQSPSLNKSIGMGYVSSAYAAEGSTIFVKVRDKLLKTKVVKIPFYRKG